MRLCGTWLSTYFWCMAICWRRWNPKIAKLHAWYSTIRKGFLSFHILLKLYNIKMSQIVVVNILDHLMPYSTVLYEEPFLATLDTLESDHLKCGLYISQVHMKVKISICLYSRTTVFSSIEICWVNLKTRRADGHKDRHVIPIIHSFYALLQRNCVYISLDDETAMP
jgi:hypothetical protein